MQLPRSGGADAETARRRLEMLASSLGGQQSSDQVPDRPPDPARGPVPERPAGRHAAQPDRPLPWRARLLGHLLDAVPPTMRGRWGITAQHVTVVALVVASALALAAWWVVRARPEPVSAPVTAASVAPPQAVTSSPAPVTEAGVPPVESVAPPGLGSTGVTSSVGLVVHVAGKVRRPGIVTLPAGSRVIDALQQAGGPRRGVDLSGLNLARPLADGEQILVGTPVPAAVPPPAPAIPGQPVPGVGAGVGAGVGPAVINLNTATSAQLEELPGIGPVTAASILQWRAEHGRFSTVEELLEVSGIGDATLADLRELVTV